MNRRDALRLLASVPLAGAALAQTAPIIQVQKLTENIFMLFGDGGNVGVVSGDNSVLMIDGGLPDLAKTLLTVISNHVDSNKVTILFDTHWHFDHIGCNETLGAIGGTKIMAQENVKKRLSTKTTMESLKRTFDPLPPEGLPSETFASGGKLTFGKTNLEYVHIPLAHTDGDSYVFFPDANILHTGDLFFNGFYPVIDYSTGGWVGGMAEAAHAMLKLGDSKLRIIPGHGPLASKTELKASGDMLSTVHKRLLPLVKQGKSVDEVVAASPLKDLDARWGTGSMKPEPFLRAAYTSILRHQKAQADGLTSPGV